MRSDYFDVWLIANGIKSGCDRCDKCDKNLDETCSVTPVTLCVSAKCDNNDGLETATSKDYHDLSHLLHLSHQEKTLTVEVLREINDEYRLWKRVKCKYCSNLNFKDICSADKISRYRPVKDRWRRCESYIAI